MFEQSKLRLAMTILARDEADIISENIRFHATNGVDKFVVTDNSSKDGTREILDDLSDDFDITVIDEPSLSIDQDLWVSRMAKWIGANDHCDWIINNDADEFWLPQGGCLKTEIVRSTSSVEGGHGIGVLTCSRQNMIGSRETASGKGFVFYQNRFAVRKNILSGEDCSKWDEGNGNIIFRKVPGKIITKPEGLIGIGIGNHHAHHEGDIARCTGIRIFHYPLRSYTQFESKVVNYGSSLENNTRWPENVSKHLRYWYECFKAGSLRDQYDLYVLSQQSLIELSEKGILEEDDRIYSRFCDSEKLAA